MRRRLDVKIQSRERHKRRTLVSSTKTSSVRRRTVDVTLTLPLGTIAFLLDDVGSSCFGRTLWEDHDAANVGLPKEHDVIRSFSG